MKSLDLKLLRDLWRMRGQALAVGIVVAVATATFVLSNGAYHSLYNTREAYYERNNFADVFVGMTRAPASIVATVGQIRGVKRAEGSIQQYATLDLPARNVPVRALVTSIDEHGTSQLNQVTLQEGRVPRLGYANEVVVDQSFADANELGPGDEIDAIIYGTRQRLRIVGVGLSPEFIFALAPGDLLPDERRFGILWMGQQALEAVTDRTEAINRLSLKLEPGASEADVIREVDVLVNRYGGTGAHGRENNLSHAFLSNELSQLQSLTRMIPPVFLLVSAFLVFIVLGRLVRTEQTQIGLLKAIGYSDAAIGLHYLKFTLIIAGLGATIGSVAGAWMGRSVTSVYANLYRFPFLHYEIRPDVFVLAGVLSMGTAALGAIGGVRAAAALAPAMAMAKPPPPVFRPGPIEALGRKAGLSPIGHIIVRHIVRWPVRSVMTILGVALSIGLLFSTLQIVDSARVMIDSSFSREQLQDMTVSFIEPRSEEVIHELAQIPGVIRAEPSRVVLVSMSRGNSSKRTIIEAAPRDSTLTARIHRDETEVPLPAGGLMLSQQLASQLGAGLGDTVQVELLGGRRTKAPFRVTSIVDEYIGARAYAATEVVDRLTRDSLAAGEAKLRIDADARESILRKLKEMPVVLGVIERSAVLEKFEQLINENILTLLRIFMVLAGAVTAGVVYNNARILFSEQAQELATLRVLGYHRHEVVMVLLGELALLVVLAVPLGCVLGYFIAQYMTAMFTSDLFRLPFAPARVTFAYAALVCGAAAILSALAVARRALQLDIVLELKSRY